MNSTYRRTIFAVLFLLSSASSGCIPALSDMLGGDSSRQLGKVCELPSDCDGIGSTGEVQYVCDQELHQCVDAQKQTFIYEKNPIAGYKSMPAKPLHPVVTQSHGPEDWAWPTEGIHKDSYKKLLAQHFALPLLVQEKNAIDTFEQDLADANFKGRTSFLQLTAQGMADQYNRLVRHDAILAPIASTLEKEEKKALRLEECLIPFSNEAEQIDLSDAELVNCLGLYLHLLPKLSDINAKREKLDPSVLSHAYDTTQYLSSQAEALMWQRSIDQGIETQDNPAILSKAHGAIYIHA
ncbi:MAG: hypothetical protein IPJ88_06465 [Myxococcales bacterium]|nr:MAG: hypothetical protein IPJ88_06465 [Myxococcales bacterium]